MKRDITLMHNIMLLEDGCCYWATAGLKAHYSIAEAYNILLGILYALVLLAEPDNID